MTHQLVTKNGGAARVRYKDKKRELIQKRENLGHTAMLPIAGLNQHLHA